MVRRVGLVALVFVACIASPVAMPNVRPFRYPISTAIEPSGLRAVFEVAPDFGTSGVVLSVSVGSADEPADQAGLAHLVEHLALQERRDGVTRMARLAAVGAGDRNAVTSWDTTTFYAFGPPANLEAMTAILAEILDDPLASVDQQTFDHELQIVRAEMHSRAEAGTQSRALGLLSEQVFPAGHPYARPVIGSEETLARLTLADARAFARAHYRPDAGVIAMSCPCSFEAQRALLTDVEGRRAWPPRQAHPGMAIVLPARGPQQAPSHPAATLATRTLPESAPTLWIGWAIPPRATAESDEAIVLSTMVGGTFWIHLYDRDRDIASVHAGISSGVQGGMFYVEAELNEGGDPEASAASVIRTMGHGLSEGTYLNDNFDAYRRFAATQIVASEEPIVSRTEHLAESMQSTGDPTYLRNQAERTTHLEAGRVGDFYRRYLAPEQARAVFVHAGSSRASAEVAARWPAGGPGDEPPPPTLEELRSWMRPPGVADAKRVTLDNGLEVVVLPRPGAQFHSVVVAYHGGRGDEEVAGAAIASLWAKDHFKASASLWGVEYADQTRYDLTFESLRATGSDLGNTFEQLRREDDFRIFWPPPQFSNRIEAFEREERSSKERFERRVRETFFGPHPYGRWVTTSLLRAVRPNDVYGFVDTIRRPSNGLVVVVGDVDTSEAIRLATAAFGQTPPPTMHTLRTPPALEHAAAKPGQRLVIEDRLSSPSVRMHLLCALPPAQDGSLGVESVFSQALAGSLHDELREEAAASYSVNGWIEALRGGTTMLVLDGDVEVARLPVAVHALRRFFEDPIATVFDDARLARARADAARGLNISLGATAPLAMRVVSAWNLGRPIEEIDRYPEVVATASREDMARLGERCRANWVLGLLGDQSRIQDGLGGWSP